MKLLVMLLLYTLLSQNASFYDKAFNDFRLNSYFVAVNIHSKEYTGYAIIENVDLYYFFSKTRNFDKEKYLVFMKEYMLNKKTLNLQDASLEKWRFQKVKANKTVESYASKGTEELIEYYFSHNTLKRHIKKAERDALIGKLFELGIASNIDDETGYLIIAR